MTTNSLLDHYRHRTGVSVWTVVLVTTLVFLAISMVWKPSIESVLVSTIIVQLPFGTYKLWRRHEHRSAIRRHYEEA